MSVFGKWPRPRVGKSDPIACEVCGETGWCEHSLSRFLPKIEPNTLAPFAYRFSHLETDDGRQRGSRVVIFKFDGGNSGKWRIRTDIPRRACALQVVSVLRELADRMERGPVE